MDSVFEQSVAGRIEELKSLYAQLFVLLDDSLGEPTAGIVNLDRASALEAPIDELMRAIEGRSQALEETLAGAGDWKSTCTTDLTRAVREYREKLATGLRVMHQRLKSRTAEFERARDDVKAELKSLQEKKRVRRGYRGPSENPVNSLLSSEA